MFIIGITGGTGSGKTTIVKEINKLLGPSEIGFLFSDSYYKDNSNLNFHERDKLNYDTPDAIDFSLLNKHIQLLKEGKEVRVPQYCFSSHLRLDSSTLFVPKKILIIEGILILSNSVLSEQINYKVFLDCSREVRFRRRLERDTKERGRTHEDVVKLFENRLDTMHDTYVEPFKNGCDMIINTEKNISLKSLIKIIDNNLK